MSFTRARALATFGVLLVAALVVAGVAVVRDTQRGPVAARCQGSVLVDMTVPNGPKDVRVRVLNGTKQPGLAEAMSTDLRNRGFRTEKPGQIHQRVDDVAILRYGPEAYASAWLLRAYLLDNAEEEYDVKRKGAVVDVVVGSGYLALATPTEVSQSIKEIGAPELPVGSCPAPRKI